MDVREKLVEIVKRAAYHCLPSNTQDFHINMFVSDLIAHGVTVQEWILVKDRLPEENGMYLTLNKKKQYEFHLFQVGKRMWPAIWEEDGVTHWMPLPQPPKEGK